MRKIAVHLVLLLVAAASAFAADMVQIATGEWAPYVSERLPDGGPFSRIVTAACREAEMEPRYVFVPWKRCEKMLIAGEVVAIYPYQKTTERSRTYAWSDPFFEIRAVFFSHNKQVSWDRLGDLKAFRVGGPIGYGDNETMRMAGLTVSEAPDEEALFRQLRGGRIDLAGISELVGWTIIKRLFPEEEGNFFATTTALSREKMHMMTKKDSAEGDMFLTRFNTGLARIRENGVLESILKENDLKP